MHSRTPRKKYHKYKRRSSAKKWLLLILLFLVILLALTGITRKIRSHHRSSSEYASKELEDRPELDVELLTVNEYSRPGIALNEVKGIVVHYTANPGASAIANRNYFESLATTGETHASSHFVIGLEGEIVQCIPCQEICYASNDRNKDTLAIECCIEDDTGKFNQKTYDSLVELTAWLVGRYDLSIDSVIRHYDVTGKNCPKYFVEHEDEWEQFKTDVTEYLVKNGTAK